MVVFYSKAPSRWASCRSIAFNLRTAYKEAAKLQSLEDLIEIGIDPKEVRKDLLLDQYLEKVASEVVNLKPKKLVFLDHTPHPLSLMRAIKRKNPRLLKTAAVYFHVYGDFTLNSLAWAELFTEFRGSNINLICASKRQQNLVNSLLKKRVQDGASVIPFPVDQRTFFYSSELRDQVRAQLGFKNHFVVLYSGRLSLQKNILFLIEEFSRFAQKSPKAVLLLGGEIDDMVSPVFGSQLPLGAHFKLLNESWSQLEPDIRKRISFLGNLDQERLCELYNASDLLFSPSLYHDEDFGMSAAEALVCGLPCLLTDWGGYTSFRDIASNVELLAVNLNNQGFKISKSEVQKKLKLFSTLELSGEERGRCAELARARLSTKAIGRLVYERVFASPSRKKFAGASERLRALGASVSGKADPLTPGKKGVYHHTYKHYYGTLHD